MGFDLWSALGITPGTGLSIAAAAILFAALLALRIFVSGRRSQRAARGLRLTDAPRGEPRP